MCAAYAQKVTFAATVSRWTDQTQVLVTVVWLVLFHVHRDIIRKVSNKNVVCNAQNIWHAHVLAS